MRKKLNNINDKKLKYSFKTNEQNYGNNHFEEVQFQ